MKAIILAAGYATRMYPLTENTPKPLLPFKDSSVIGIIVEQINSIPAIDEIFVITNSKFYSRFVQWAEGCQSSAPVTVIDDNTSSNDNRLGATGDVAFVINNKNINDELMVIAGDNYNTYDIKKQYDFYKKNNADTLVGKQLDDIDALRAFAVAVVTKDGQVLDLEEKPAVPKSNIAIYATYFFTKSTVPLFSQYLAEGNNSDNIGAFPAWLYPKKPVYVYMMDGDCHDIGTIEMYNKLK